MRQNISAIDGGWTRNRHRFYESTVTNLMLMIMAELMIGPVYCVIQLNFKFYDELFISTVSINVFVQLLFKPSEFCTRKENLISVSYYRTLDLNAVSTELSVISDFLGIVVALRPIAQQYVVVWDNGVSCGNALTRNPISSLSIRAPLTWVSARRLWYFRLISLLRRLTFLFWRQQTFYINITDCFSEFSSVQCSLCCVERFISDTQLFH